MPRQFVAAITFLRKARERPRDNFKLLDLHGNAHTERAAGAFAAVRAMTIGRRANGSLIGKSNVATKAATRDDSAHAIPQRVMMIASLHADPCRRTCAEPEILNYTRGTSLAREANIALLADHRVGIAC